MKNHLNLLASLTLGLLVASCQNDVNEPILTDEVQNELATTRAGNNDVIPLVGDVEEVLSELTVATSTATINGPGVIGGSSLSEYKVQNVPDNTTIVWSYNTSYFTQTSLSSDKKTIKLQANGLSSTVNTSVIVYFYNVSDGSLNSYAVKDVGVYGPHYNDCSIRVLRSSDGAEVYPSHAVSLEPNTYYYAYFSTTTGGSDMNLTWTFYDSGVTLLSTYGYTAYFQTGNINSCFLHLDGIMPAYGVSKSLLGIGLY